MEITATEIAFLALLLFIGLLVYLKVPAAIMGALDSKSQAVAKELHDARKLREEAEALLAEYEAKRVAAEAEAKAIIDSAKEQAALVAEETRASMTAAIKRREQQAEDRIAQAEARAAAEVRAAASDAALAAAEKLIRERLSDKVQSALVAEGVAEIGRKFG
ncbi:MAG: ATP F0F1 synthase subunit B [Caulobacterales bacterium]|jgi:F-type H+-transporting ATPase subunit b|nr:ATP F0F1 synthase subunit B [Caulobacterales bacterium]